MPSPARRKDRVDGARHRFVPALSPDRGERSRTVPSLHRTHRRSNRATTRQPLDDRRGAVSVRPMDILSRIGIRKREPTPITVIEYWVYLPGIQMPPQDVVTTYLLQERPYSTRSGAPVGPREGLLFSDIRLHMALVLRSKNPHAFRPDLFESTTEPTAEILERLSEAHSFVKIRYLSETPLLDSRHLQLLPHLTDAVAQMGNGNVIYDVVAERLMTREEMQGQLKASFDATKPEFHVRVVWRQDREGYVAETRGLAKKGIAEWRTVPMSGDERVLVQSVLESGSHETWTDGGRSKAIRVDYFDDQYTLELEAVQRGKRLVRILRRNPI